MSRYDGILQMIRAGHTDEEILRRYKELDRVVLGVYRKAETGTLCGLREDAHADWERGAPARERRQALRQDKIEEIGRLWREGFLSGEIAERTGVSKATVFRHRPADMRPDVQSRRDDRARKQAAVMRMIRAGALLMDICRETGVSRVTVRRYRKMLMAEEGGNGNGVQGIREKAAEER